MTDKNSQIFTNVQSLNECLSSLPKDAFVVAFFMHIVNVSQDEWLDPLAEYLNEKGFVTIGIKTPLSIDKCDLSSAKYQAVIDVRDIVDIVGVNVFIISDMDGATNFPKNTKVLGCLHSFTSEPDVPLAYSTYCGSQLDGWMVPFPINNNKKAIADLWGGLLNMEASSRKNPTFQIIPTGYPRMHILSKRIKNLKQTPNSVVYAPIEIDYCKDIGGNRVQRYGKRLIRTILSNFPDLNVIFRPYKTNLDYPEVREICDAFANDPRFMLDDNSDRAYSFAHGLVLVTDFSHVGQSFSFSTLRGSIKFQPWIKNDKKHLEWRNSYFSYNFTDLVFSIKDMIKRSDYWSQKILAQRNASVVPFENSFEELSGWLDDFYHGKSRPEWLEIQRRQPSNLFGLQELVTRITEQPPSAQSTLSASIYAYTMPDDPLILALGLHIGKLYQPKSYIIWRYHAERTFAQCIDKQLTAKSYGEIENEDVIRLYSLGLLQRLKNNDAEGAALAQNLLDSFKNLSSADQFG